MEEVRKGQTYQISQRVKLLTHQTTLVPPPRNPSIEEIKEHAKREEVQRHPDIFVVVRIAKAVPER
jgi:hypothetical protein